MVVCTLFTTIFSLIENTLGLKYQVKIDSERRGGSPSYILFGLFIGVFFNNGKLWDLVDYGLVLLGLVNIIVIIKLQQKFKENIYEK